jgi:hypothetical protein
VTGNLFTESFYVGNALGSFNSSGRLITGLRCGLAVVWLAYPFAKTYFRELRQMLEPRLERLREAGVARTTVCAAAPD